LKILLYIFYFLRSVILRGFFNTIKLGTLEMKHEKRFSINTGSIKASADADYFHYQGAGYDVILKIFGDLAPGRENYHFVDIGCGKGRAVIVAENAGFNRITGIELHADLLRVASENLKSYTMKRSASVITLLEINALNYEYKDEPAVYFMFNPFAAHVLKNVLLKILQNTRSETYFIYMNPRFANVFAELGIKKQRVYKTRFYTEAIVFHLEAQI
jgi:SAM-dependent methyltransferase